MFGRRRQKDEDTERPRYISVYAYVNAGLFRPPTPCPACADGARIRTGHESESGKMSKTKSSRPRT